MKTVSFLRPAAAVAVVAALAIGASSALASAGNAGNHNGATASGHRHHKHKTKRGPRGPRGVPGPAGPAGPGGPAGTGTPYVFALRTNTATAPVFAGNGVLIEAGCIAGALELTVRPQGGDHNIVEVTSFDNTEGGVPRGVSVPEAAINQPISMLAGGSPFHDFNGLLAVRTLTGLMTTVQWWAMGSINASQGDCVGGGTVSP
jgi:hypothetical protein